MPNYDEKTGIRYGVISPDSISDWSIDEIYQDGTDPHYESAHEELTEKLNDLFEFIGLHDEKDKEDLTDQIENIFNDRFESCGDGQMDYSDEEYDLHVSGDNFGIFVMRSPYYTFCRGCSPCAPGAGSLNEPVDPSDESKPSGNCWISTNEKTLCLGPEWFDKSDDQYARKIPYRVFRVSDDTEVI